MKRSEFLKSLAIVSAGSFFSHAGSISSIQGTDEVKRGWRLKIGDTIGLVSPAGFITEKELSESITNIQSLGFKVKTGLNVLNRTGYLAGTDSQRAEDLNTMFADKDVKGIICTRGGYGASRLLDLLDYELIARNPKPLIGYSDITALHIALWEKCRLISFHGPVGISSFNNYSISNFTRTLVSPDFLPFSNAIEENTSSAYIPFTIQSGIAKGRLMGGNLSIFVSLIGTKYEPDTTGAILFLEEVGEEPYRIDRMLTQLIQSGKIEKCSGIMLGVFSKCEPKEEKSGIGNSFTLSEVLYDRLYGFKIPTVYGMSFGHIVNKLTIPYGALAELNTEAKTISYLESPVL